MDWSTVTGMPGPIFQVATSKDLLVYFDTSNSASAPVKRGTTLPTGAPVMAIRRRNADGIYVPVGNFTDVTSPFASTNGKWVVVPAKGVALFSIDSNNHISNTSFVTAIGGFLLSDDTFVAYDPISPLSDGNFTIRTYQYEASNNTWLNIPGTEVIVTTSATVLGDFSTYRATDTHLVVADYTNISDVGVHIYERQADKSWKFIESVPVNSSIGPSSVTYNGVDTLVYANFGYQPTPDEYGIVIVYTKSNGTWNEQTFTISSLNYRPLGYLGYTTVFLDANTFLVNANQEGYARTGGHDGVGKVLMMTRNANGTWEPAIELLPSTPAGLWGLGVGANDYDIIIPRIIVPVGGNIIGLTFFTTPRCFTQPINVTCNFQQISDCSQVDISALYTVNNPQCGAIDTTLTGFGLVANTAIQAQLSFTKFFGAPVSCNATVICPAPPVAVTQTPSKVSSAGALEFAVTSLVAYVVVMFL